MIPVILVQVYRHVILGRRGSRAHQRCSSQLGLRPLQPLTVSGWCRCLFPWKLQVPKLSVFIPLCLPGKYPPASLLCFPLVGSVGEGELYPMEHKAVCRTLTLLKHRQGKLLRPCYLGPSPPSWDRFLTNAAHTPLASSRRAIQAVLSARCIRCNIMRAINLAALRTEARRRAQTFPHRRSRRRTRRRRIGRRRIGRRRTGRPRTARRAAAGAGAGRSCRSPAPG